MGTVEIPCFFINNKKIKIGVARNFTASSINNFGSYFINNDINNYASITTYYKTQTNIISKTSRKYIEMSISDFFIEYVSNIYNFHTITSKLSLLNSYTDSKGTSYRSTKNGNSYQYDTYIISATYSNSSKTATDINCSIRTITTDYQGYIKTTSSESYYEFVKNSRYTYLPQYVKDVFSHYFTQYNMDEIMDIYLRYYGYDTQWKNNRWSDYVKYSGTLNYYVSTYNGNNTYRVLGSSKKYCERDVIETQMEVTFQSTSTSREYGSYIIYSNINL